MIENAKNQLKERCSSCQMIKEFDPIRQIRVYGGRFQGWHKIYCSEKVFRKDNPKYKKDIIRPYWEGEPNDWVFADDGYVLQILDKYELINKFYKKMSEKMDKGKTTVFIFATRMTRIYKRMDGTINANRFLGNYIPLYRNNLAPETYNPLGRYMTERKRNFVLHLANGLPPSIAYMKAYNVNYSLAKSRGYRLAIEDEEVMEELRKHTNTNILDDLDDIDMTGPEILKCIKEIRKEIKEEKQPSVFDKIKNLIK